VGAIQSLLKNSHEGLPEGSLPYAWQTIMEGPFRAPSLTKPSVEGMGLFAEMFAMEKGQMAMTNWPSVERLVVGSPIYIRQVVSGRHAA